MILKHQEAPERQGGKAPPQAGTRCRQPLHGVGEAPGASKSEALWGGGVAGQHSSVLPVAREHVSISSLPT